MLIAGEFYFVKAISCRDALHRTLCSDIPGLPVSSITAYYHNKSYDGQIFSAEKVAILKMHLVDKVVVSAVCDVYSLQTNGG